MLLIRNSTGIAICAAALALPACTSTGENSVLGSAARENAQVRATNPNAGTRLINTTNDLSDYCPVVRIRGGTDTYRVFPKGADKEDPDKVRFQATITKVARDCTYQGQQLLIKVGALGRVINGPDGATGSFEMPIRVAVTEGDEVVYSKLHRPEATIPDGGTNNQFSFVDEEVSIPAPRRKNVRLFVGFDEGPYDTQ